MKTKKMFKVGIGLAGAIGLSTILKDKKNENNFSIIIKTQKING
ncbi:MULTISPECIES: hypothetical protein [Bacillus]|nr:MULTISPECIES: hypothetical protein [Bacillus]